MKKVILIATLSAILTACSGGGGKSGLPKLPELPKLPKLTYEKNPVIRGSVLYVGEKQIDLAREPEGLHSHRLRFGSKAEYYKQQYSVFGYELPSDSRSSRVNKLRAMAINKDKVILDYNATPFNRLPAQGISTYVGKSYGPDSTGELVLNANFGAKTVSGRIFNQTERYGNEKLEDIELLQTAIKPHKSASVHFSGEAKTATASFGYAGAFSGPRAEEVIGLVSDGSQQIKAGFIGKK